MLEALDWLIRTAGTENKHQGSGTIAWKQKRVQKKYRAVNWVRNWNKEMICIAGLTGTWTDKKSVGSNDSKHNCLNRRKKRSVRNDSESGKVQYQMTWEVKDERREELNKCRKCAIKIIEEKRSGERRKEEKGQMISKTQSGGKEPTRRLHNLQTSCSLQPGTKSLVPNLTIPWNWETQWTQVS